MNECMRYTLIVNGEAMAVEAAASSTLLEVLREALRLTGTKRGCNQGVCGACTVWLDGRPVRACLTLSANVGEREVRTIEGMAERGALTPLQRCFVEKGALQCGFCTSGMVMSLQAFLRDHPCPTREEVRSGLSGQLCRCTGYVKIIDAAIAASQASP